VTQPVAESRTPAGAALGAEQPGWRARLRGAVASERADTAGLLLGLVALGLVFTIKSPYFFSIENFSAVGVAISMYVVVASVQTIVLVSGGVDLSITSTLALSGLVAQWVLQHGAPLSAQLAVAIAVGAVVGLVNAVVIVGVGVNPLIATIGTGFAVRGLAYIWTKGKYADYFSGKSLNWLGTGTLLTVKVPILIMLAVFVTVGLWMRFTRFGSRVYAIGGSEYAARMAGISILRLRTLVYVLSGISAGFGGVLLTAMNGTSFPQAGLGEELLILGAVIIGGTSLAGGRGTVWGTFLGVCLLGVLQNGLNLVGVQSYWQTFIQGIILVLAVTSDEIRRRARGR
jgi:ribose/xylose/arabinose/galactoside ABC-type transport system permease subunit